MTAPRYEYTRRTVPSLISLGLLAAVSFLSSPGFVPTLTAIAVGFGVGWAAGHATWIEIQKRIDSRNSMIMYFTDTAAYALLLLAFLATIFPYAFARSAVLAIRHPTAFGAVLVFVVAASVGYNLMLMHFMRRHELAAGPLQVKRYYASSVVGVQGMIGRRGLVIRPCAPEGTIRVGAEIWSHWRSGMR